MKRLFAKIKAFFSRPAPAAPASIRICFFCGSQPRATAVALDHIFAYMDMAVAGGMEFRMLDLPEGLHPNCAFVLLLRCGDIYLLELWEVEQLPAGGEQLLRSRILPPDDAALLESLLGHLEKLDRGE